MSYGDAKDAAALANARLTDVQAKADAWDMVVAAAARTSQTDTALGQTVRRIIAGTEPPGR
jgi:hypothetical protein